MATERGGKEAPTCRTPQQQPSKGREGGWKKSRKVRKAAVLSLFWDFVRKLETRTREGDQAGFYKHLKTINLDGKRDRSSAYVKDEDGVLPRDVELIRERWVRWFSPFSTPSYRSSTRTLPKALTSGPRTHH